MPEEKFALAIEEKRGLEAYLERGREWLQEMGQRSRDPGRAGMASLTMRAGLQTSADDGFDALPAPDQSPRHQQTRALGHGQDERNRQRQRQSGHDRDGPDIGFGR